MTILISDQKHTGVTGRRSENSRDRRLELKALNPEVADDLEAAIRRDFFKLMSSQSQVAAKAAGRAVDVSAEDFDDSEDDV